VNPNYTVFSQEKSEIKLSSSEGVARGEAREKSGNLSAFETGRGRRSADGILTIKTGNEGQNAEEPEMMALKRLGLHMPLRFKKRLKNLYPADARSKSKRIEIDPLEMYKLLQHYQMRLNESSLTTMQKQEEAMKKITQVEHSLWQMAHTAATCGVNINALETHLSEAWNMEKMLNKTKIRLGEIVKRIDSILGDDRMREDVRTDLGPPPFIIAPQYTSSFYLKLNYLTLTPFYQQPSITGSNTLSASGNVQRPSTPSTPTTSRPSEHSQGQEHLREIIASPPSSPFIDQIPKIPSSPSPLPSTSSFHILSALERAWIDEILPFWESRINSKRAQALWRKGIPPRLRAFIWQKAIGNRLGLTREMYYEALALQKSSEPPIHSDPDYITATSNEVGRERSPSPSSHPLTPPAASDSLLKGALSSEIESIPTNISTSTDASINESGSSHHHHREGSDIQDGTVEIDLSDPSTRTTDPVLEVISTSPRIPSTPIVAPIPTTPMSIGMEIHEGGIRAVDESGEEIGGDPSNKSPSPVAPETAPNSASPQPNTTTVIAHTAKGKNTRSLIIRDSLRTFSKIGIFRTPKSAPHEDLVNVLYAVSSRRPDVGYVQGQSFVAGVLLMYMPVEEAFVALANLLDHHFFKSFCTFNLENIKLHVSAFETLLKQQVPSLYDHFQRLHVLPEHYLFDWYVTLFAKPLPLLQSGLIWDCYLMEGPNFIPRITVAILKQFSTRLLQFNFEECMKLLQQLPEDLDIAQVISEL
jgi:hypothetical protein